MKFKFIKITSIAILGMYCQTNSKKPNISIKNTQRFSTDLDTFYKDNSIDIDRIYRTFYNFIDTSSSTRISLRKDISENKINMYYTNSSKVQMAVFSDTTKFYNFIKDARSIINNPTKQLRYDFGNRDNCKMKTGNLNGTIFMYLTDLIFEEGMTINIEASEIDSMESCFNRYLKEPRD